MILTAAAIVLAQWGTPDIGNPWAVIPPPAQYDHAYAGKLTVITGTDLQIHKWCWGGGAYDARACADPGNGICTIYLPAYGDPAIIGLLRRHEIAHCNGWPASHPSQ